MNGPPAAAPVQQGVLSILVPAWKPDYLHQALASIAAQTDQRFVVMIFDDAAPVQIREIAAQFPQFEYVRFDTNLGGSDLIAHWNRCLEKVSTEWVWMFSDDDVMSSNCVSEFYQGLASAPDAAVFQFSVRQVDSQLELIAESRAVARESAEEFISARLRSAKISCVPDHVFNWAALREQAGGFVNFPLAWNSDDATWALLARKNGIVGLERGVVSWRQSDQNISSSLANSRRKFDADVRYLAWLGTMGFRISYWKQVKWLAARIAYVYDFGKEKHASVAAALPHRLRPALVLAGLYPMLRLARNLANRARPR